MAKTIKSIALSRTFSNSACRTVFEGNKGERKKDTKSVSPKQK